MRKIIEIFTILFISLSSQAQDNFYQFKTNIQDGISYPSDILFKNKKVGTLIKVQNCKGDLCFGKLELNKGFQVFKNMRFFKQNMPLGNPIIVIELDNNDSSILLKDTINIMNSPKNDFIFNGIVEKIEIKKSGYTAYIKRIYDNKSVEAYIDRSNITIKLHYKKLKIGQAVTVYGDKIINQNKIKIIVHEIE